MTKTYEKNYYSEKGSFAVYKAQKMYTPLSPRKQFLLTEDHRRLTKEFFTAGVFSIASDGVGLAIVTTVVFSAISLLRIKHWSRNRNYKHDRTEEKIDGLFTGTYGTQGRPANRLGRELAQPCI